MWESGGGTIAGFQIRSAAARKFVEKTSTLIYRLLADVYLFFTLQAVNILILLLLDVELAIRR